MMTCKWTFDELGVWITACGETWEFMCGGISDNSVKYCPFCGRLVEEEDEAT